ncbi:uncharacterized protein LOC107271198 [Cephus cinctus]|uniref:Uncharacterized protein LOC107271198 n=1 Tax=Cephus cinctus TaxID=211228 RepID=A0AAJ7RNG2_CEPCN|nr:uncharacterized protein LOC107271198 [Cephus cinctus]
MAKLLCTIWALLFNTVGISIFHTCFSNSIEDENGETILIGPPITGFLFASGVYIIILKLSLFPTSFRKLKPSLLCLYEFLTCSFILEFAIACIWASIDHFLLTTIPKILCQILIRTGYVDIGAWITANKSIMALLNFIVSLSFFLLSLHVTRSVDFTIWTDCGAVEFVQHVQYRLLEKLMSELPRIGHVKRHRRGRRHGPSRSRSCDDDS